MSDNLKKCPLCGAEAKISYRLDVDRDTWYFIGCSECSVGFRGMGSGKEAIKNWNKRNAK